MGICRVPVSYGVDVEVAHFPFFRREDEGMLVTPTIVLGTTDWVQGLRVQQQFHVQKSVSPTKPLFF